MSVIVPFRGSPRRLDRPAEPSENITEEDLKQPAKVVDLFLRLLRDVATLLRRWWPRRIDYEDFFVDSGGAEYRFPHGFDTRVRWWPVDWKPDVSGTPHQIERVDGTGKTDNKTLVLKSGAAGVVTLRVEEAG
jgi:hypothetical protein